MRVFTNAVRGFKPAVTLYLKPHSSATTIQITDSQLVQGSLALRSGTSLNGQFTVGGAVIGSLSFAILDKDKSYHTFNWYDSKIKMRLDYPNNEYIETGWYFVVSHKESGLRVSVECYDAMKVLDEYEIYEDQFDFSDNLTVGQALSTICTNRSLTYSGLTLSERSKVLADPKSDTLTERAFISYIAQMLGKFVVADGDELKFGWYDPSTVYDEGVTFSHDLQTKNYQIGTVKVLANDNTTLATQGSGGKVLEISGNPFITASNVNSVASVIYNAVYGLNFRPGSVSIVSDGKVQAGDTIQITTGQEQNIIMLATNITFYPTKLKMTVQADAPSTDGDLRITRSQYIRKAAQQAVSEELDDPNSDLSQAIAAGGGTVVHFPKVEMRCYDPSTYHALEAPCDASRNGTVSYLVIGTNGTVRGFSSNTGYEFNRIIWMANDVVIPPYDSANVNKYFDVTLYLYMMSGDGNSAIVEFLAYDSAADVNYPLPIHTRAKYGGSASLIFEKQWVWMPANYSGFGNQLHVLRIPIPSLRFNLTTNLWEFVGNETYHAPLIYS